MKRILALTLSILTALTITACSGNSQSSTSPAGSSVDSSTGTALKDSKTLMIAHVMSEADPYHLGVKKFADLVAEKTDGRINFTIYSNGQLGAERDITEGVSMGTVDMAIITNAFCVNMAPQMGVLDFPYLFRDHEEAYKILDSEIGTELFTYLEASNIKGLAYMENGFRNLTTTKYPVTDPAQLKGMKIRTMETPVHLAAFNAAGANATPMAASELFTSLQQGAVDGQENPLKSIYDYKFYEVTPYINMTEHFYSSANLIMNLDVWNSLSAEDQQIFLDCAKEATDYQRDSCAKREIEVKQLLQDAGCTISENIDKEKWAEAMSPVYKDENMLSQYGVYLDKIKAALGR